MSIVLRTSIPGPKSMELAARRAKAVPSSVSMITPVFGAIRMWRDGRRC